MADRQKLPSKGNDKENKVEARAAEFDFAAFLMAGRDAMIRFAEKKLRATRCQMIVACANDVVDEVILKLSTASERKIWEKIVPPFHITAPENSDVWRYVLSAIGKRIITLTTSKCKTCHYETTVFDYTWGSLNIAEHNRVDVEYDILVDEYFETPDPSAREALQEHWQKLNPRDRETLEEFIATLKPGERDTLEKIRSLVRYSEMSEEVGISENNMGKIFRQFLAKAEKFGRRKFGRPKKKDSNSDRKQ